MAAARRRRSSSHRREGVSRRIVIGMDGSRQASRVVGHVARWAGGGRATLVRVVEPVRLPSLGLVPASIRTRLQSAARAELAARLRAARREVTAAAARLRRAGWLARAVVRVGVPLPQLLRTIREERANVLALGATLVSLDEARAIVSTWLTTSMREPRYIRRLAKIRDLEER